MSSKKGFITISGPSGVGKTTLIQNMLNEFPSLTRIVSYTTRAKRSGEVSGKDYFFISEEEFFKKRDQGEFVEWVHIFDHYSATSKAQVHKAWDGEKVIIKDVDLNGCKALSSLYSGVLSIGIFVNNEDDIRSRIQKRGLTPGENLEKRLEGLSAITKELKSVCSVHIYNDNIDEATQSLKKAIESYLDSL